MEAACRRASDIGLLNYTSVKSILATGMNRVTDQERSATDLPADHENVRGPDYYADSDDETEE